MSDLAARLTEASTTVAGALTADEVAAMRRYQALDRTYELVNRLLRGEPLNCPTSRMLLYGRSSDA